MSYTFDTNNPIWSIRFTESLTNFDLMNILREFQPLELARGNVPDRFVDVRQVHAINIGFMELSHFASERRKLKFPNNFRTAIATNNPVQFGIARMFQTLLEHPQITVEIFKDEESAMKWLSTETPR